MLGEVSRVLARPARNFEHEAGFWQPLAQHRGDRLAIAQRCGRGAARTRLRRLVKASLAGHSAAWAGSASRYVRIGLRAARVSSSRRRGAWTGADLRVSSPAFARSAIERTARMNSSRLALDSV